MRRILSILSLCLVMTASYAYSYDLEINGIFYNINLVNKTAEVVAGNKGYIGDVVIPDEISYSGRSFKVISIASEVFCNIGTSEFGRNSISSIVLPNTLISIGYRAFGGCKKLKTINIPELVESIGSNCFDGCNSLESITVSPNNKKYSDLDGILCTKDKRKIIKCPVAKNVGDFVASSPVTEIGESAFASCQYLTSIVLSNSVKTINFSAFSLCENLTKVEIMNSSIEIYVGCLCSSIKELYLYATTPPEMKSTMSHDIINGGPEKYTLHLNKLDCKLYVPAESIELYKKANVWRDIWNILPLEGGVPEVKNCANPKISIENGKIIVKSTTKNSKCYTTITAVDAKSYEGNSPIDVTGTYTITAYAFADGYANSETVTKTLYMSNPSFDGKEEAKTDTVYKEVIKEVIKEVTVEVHDTIYIYDDSKSDIKLPDGHECTLYVRNGKIMITDAPIGTNLVVYNIVGTKEKELTVTDFITEIDLPRNNIYIVNIAGKVFKVKI